MSRLGWGGGVVRNKALGPRWHCRVAASGPGARWELLPPGRVLQMLPRDCASRLFQGTPYIPLLTPPPTASHFQVTINSAVCLFSHLQTQPPSLVFWDSSCDSQCGVPSPREVRAQGCRRPPRQVVQHHGDQCATLLSRIPCGLREADATSISSSVPGIRTVNPR